MQKKILLMFGLTYLCEQLFYSMKFTKNKLRTKITDNHLNDVLKIAYSSISPDISKLAQKKSSRSKSTILQRVWLLSLKKDKHLKKCVSFQDKYF